MKFLLLMHAEPGAWMPEEHPAAIQESVAVCHDLAASGRYLHASPLHPPETAVCVRVRDGMSKVWDGPFAETKEQLGGYFLIDVPTLDDAIAVAARSARCATRHRRNSASNGDRRSADHANRSRITSYLATRSVVARG
ncbi:MAG: YciI family protein [Pirellulales bacterium]